MENTIIFDQDYVQELPLVTLEKEQVAKAPSWYPKPPKEKVCWGQTKKTPGWSDKKRAHEPETKEEAAKRRKYWCNGWRLYHEDALVGGVHCFYKHPKRIARIVHIFRGNRPIVQVRSLFPPFEYKIIFTVELDRNQRNSNRSRRNWCKRHAAYKRRAWAEKNLRIFGLPWPALEHEPNSSSTTVKYEPDKIKSATVKHEPEDDPSA